MIKLTDVSKIYKMGSTEIRALRDIDMHIKKGEFVSIMGPSGSGKSTMLHLIGVLDSQSKGNIIINDKDVAAMKDEEKTSFRLANLGYVFQDYALLPEMTALENVALPLLMQNIDEKVAYQKATEALINVGLEKRLYNLPSKLSGGEQQRVSIAQIGRAHV